MAAARARPLRVAHLPRNDDQARDAGAMARARHPVRRDLQAPAAVPLEGQTGLGSRARPAAPTRPAFSARLGHPLEGERPLSAVAQRGIGEACFAAMRSASSAETGTPQSISESCIAYRNPVVLPVGCARNRLDTG